MSTAPSILRALMARVFGRAPPPAPEPGETVPALHDSAAAAQRVGLRDARLGGWYQDEAGRLWDIVWMLRFAIRKAQSGQDRLPFALYVRNDNRRPKLVKLIATCGALDINDPQPAITVMMPDED